MNNLLNKGLSLALSLALLLTLIPISYADDTGVLPERQVNSEQVLAKEQLDTSNVPIESAVILNKAESAQTSETEPLVNDDAEGSDEQSNDTEPALTEGEVEQADLQAELVAGQETPVLTDNTPLEKDQELSEDKDSTPKAVEESSVELDVIVEDTEKDLAADEEAVELVKTVEEGLLDEFKQAKQDDELTNAVAMFSVMNSLGAMPSNNQVSKPGELSINKTATKVGKNLFDVELTINGKDKREHTDIILVIDRSGSMGASGYNDRMTPTKQAVEQFINTVIPQSSEGTINVGIMTFDSEITYPTAMQLTNDKDTLINELYNNSAFEPRGNTFTHMAFKTAREVLEQSTATNKYMILLTDGLPSISYQLKDWEKGSKAIWAKEPYIKKLPDDAKIHPSDIVGNDYCITEDINMATMVDYEHSYNMSDTPSGTYNNAHIYNDEIYIQMKWDPKDENGNYPFDPFLNLNNLYKAEAKLAQEQNIQTYAIGIDMFDIGNKIMSDLVGDDNVYNTTTAGLETIYSQLAEEVKYAATNANITDPMGEMFSMVDINGDGIVDKKDVAVIDKNGDVLTDAELTWDEAAETIKLTIPKVTEALSPIKIKYQVILDGENPQDGVEYPTNGTTTIDYTDSAGSSIVKKEFPIPTGSLKDARITTNYVLVDGEGNLIKTDGTNNPAMNLDDARIKTESKGYDLGSNIEVVAPMTFTKDGITYKYVAKSSVVGTQGTFETNISPSTVNTTVTPNMSICFTYEKVPENNGDDTNNSQPTPKKKKKRRRDRDNDNVVEEVIIEEEETPLAKLDTANHNAYLVGYVDGSVRPNGLLKREEAAAVFFRLLDKDYRDSIRTTENKFDDVHASDWSNKHISTLANGDILKGYLDGSFRPDENITRAELAVIASKFDKLEYNAEHNFSDITEHWAEKYIASAVAKGWVNGYEDGTFKPDQYITRAEFVTFVNNVLDRHVKLEDILKDAKEFTDLKDTSKWYYCPMKVATNSYNYEQLEPENAIKFQKWTEIINPFIEF